MTDKTISQLPAATSLSGSDVVPIVHNGVTYKTDLATVFAGAPWGVMMINGTQEVRTTAGALSLSTTISIVSNAGGSPITMTLANGINGQVKIVIAETSTSAVNVTGTGNNWSSLSLLSGNSVILWFYNNKWHIISKNIG